MQAEQRHTLALLFSELNLAPLMEVFTRTPANHQWKPCCDVIEALVSSVGFPPHCRSKARPSEKSNLLPPALLTKNASPTRKATVMNVWR
jgi:hypothetical protein